MKLGEISMKNVSRFALSLAAVLALLVSANPARALGQSAAKSTDATPPSYDLKPQALLDLQDLQKKFVSLAQAVPAEKYTWRPGPGVRSIAEVYLHIAGANFTITSDLATMPAPTSAPQAKDYETSTTDKARIIDQLKQSFDYARAAIEKMSNADFKNPVKKYGPEANEGDIVYLIVTHAHEHLGQSIAYARMNGVVPPWTAAAAAKAKAPKE
jgi:uncharacterized damage-inducible protein DinB